jgi:hypothetical protein
MACDGAHLVLGAAQRHDPGMAWLVMHQTLWQDAPLDKCQAQVYNTELFPFQILTGCDDELTRGLPTAVLSCPEVL